MPVVCAKRANKLDRKIDFHFSCFCGFFRKYWSVGCCYLDCGLLGQSSWLFSNWICENVITSVSSMIEIPVNGDGPIIFSSEHDNCIFVTSLM